MLHGTQAVAGRVARADHDTGMQAHGSDLLGIAQCHHRRHAGARGQARQVYLVGTDVPPGRQRIDQYRQRLRLAAALLGTQIEPLPAALHLAPQGLLGIGHHEAFALGEGVHPRARREVFRLLPAAMQHHHQRHGPLGRAGRHVKPVGQARDQFARQRREAVVM